MDISALDDKRRGSGEALNSIGVSDTKEPIHQHHGVHRSASFGETQEKGVYTREFEDSEASNQKPTGDDIEAPVDDGERKAKRWHPYRRQIRIAVHLAIWLLFTG